MSEHDRPDDEAKAETLKPTAAPRAADLHKAVSTRPTAAPRAADVDKSVPATPAIDETPTLEAKLETPAEPKKEKKKKDKKEKKEKKKAAEDAVTQEVRLTDEQKEAIRLRTEGRLKKEFERSVDAKLRQDLQVDEAELKNLKKRLTKAQGSPERGIETWFRLASRNLYTRRQIVDTKSNILITVNSIILSVVLGTMSREIADQPHLAIAIVPLVVANLFSMAFAIFATKPKVSSGVFTQEELESQKVSLMTFDDFYKMDAETYAVAIARVIEDRTLLYGTIQRDIYALGIDLSRRYLQIQRSYSVFLTGIVFATILFGVTTYYFA